MSSRNYYIWAICEDNKGRLLLGYRLMNSWFVSEGETLSYFRVWTRDTLSTAQTKRNKYMVKALGNVGHKKLHEMNVLCPQKYFDSFASSSSCIENSFLCIALHIAMQKTEKENGFRKYLIKD